MERSTGVEDVAAKFLTALSNGEMAELDSLISEEDFQLFVGTDAKEWWSNRTALMRALDAQVKEMVGFTFFPSTTEGFEHGDVGWFGTRFSITAPDGSVTPARFTGTLVKAQARWRIVQAHVSVGAPNEEVVGKELTV